MSFSNTGSVDLESVLNVRRRTLAAIGESASPRQQHHYTDTIYLKREDDSNSILSINSKIFIFGELQLLYSIFERYTSNITIYEETYTDTNPSSPSDSHKPSFTPTVEENENDEEEPPIVSTLRHTSLASSSPKGSVSPSQIPGSPSRGSGSPTRKKTLSSTGRSQTIVSTSSDFALHNLEGKRYGCIQLPNMAMIEILEILLRTGLDLAHVSSDFDKEHVLHQNFVFAKTRQSPPKHGLSFSRTSSFTGT
jgi:hypothetical protein